MLNLHSRLAKILVLIIFSLYLTAGFALPGSAEASPSLLKSVIQEAGSFATAAQQALVGTAVLNQATDSGARHAAESKIQSGINVTTNRVTESGVVEYPSPSPGTTGTPCNVWNYACSSPTPTPTVTPTPDDSPMPYETPLPDDAPTPSYSPTPHYTPIVTPTPHYTPTATPTPSYTPTPTPTPTGLCATVESITPSTLSAKRGEEYSQQFNAKGGVGDYYWLFASMAFSDFSRLPEGTSFSNTGKLSGIPKRPGRYVFELWLYDQGGRVYGDAQVFLLTVSCAIPRVTTDILPSGTINQGYQAQLEADDEGNKPYNWSVIGLPQGLTVDSATGVISGTPTEGGLFELVAKVGNNTCGPNGCTEEVKKLSLVIVSDQLIITTPVLPQAIKGDSYHEYLGAAGGAGYQTWQLIDEAGVPDGLELSESGVISGAPTEAGDYYFSVMAVDGDGNTDIQTVNLKVVTEPTLPRITTATLPNARHGENYSEQLEVEGGTAPYKWEIIYKNNVGHPGYYFPPGLSLNDSTGVLSGVPVIVDEYAYHARYYNFTVKVTDSKGESNTKEYLFPLKRKCV